MEPIELIVHNETFIALPMPDGSFEIFQGKNKLGTIHPNIDNPLQIQWETADLFSLELADAIGKAIEAKEM